MPEIGTQSNKIIDNLKEYYSSLYQARLSPFCTAVIGPFEGRDRDEALRILGKRLPDKSAHTTWICKSRLYSLLGSLRGSIRIFIGSQSDKVRYIG